MFTREQFPKTYEAFYRWFSREGWGAESVDDLSDRGWDAWFPDFLRENEVSSAEEFENKK